MQPVFDPTTERVYEQLPYHYRVRDEVEGYPLKKYLSGLLKNQDDVNTIIDRLTYTPLDDFGKPGSTSDLVNPRTADLNWLAWLGQLFGTQVTGSVTEEVREAIIKASGFRAGTTDSIVAAAQKVLVGTKKVRIIKHADDSWQPDMVERVYRTNLLALGSFETEVSGANPGVTNSGGAAVTRDTSWHLLGSSSAKIVASTNNASGMYLSSQTREGAWFLNLIEGETYTVSATARLTTAHNVTGASSVARAISVGRKTISSGVTVPNWAVSPSAPNSPGEYRLSLTFTVPEDTDTVFVRLMNGSATPGDTIWWDNAMLEKGDLLGDYFDGSEGDLGGYSVRWLGDPNRSPSQLYIPAITNTATEWDLLVMTLQSETLTNLLQPTLAQSLAPSAWDCYYDSFGYDPSYVWKGLAKQEGVYQNRAFSFSLRDTEWQASVESSTGFGASPFGASPFGLSTDITSKLRLLSNTDFNVVPTDKYQFHVDLGLQQDVADEKRSAIGFQFYESDGTVINKVESQNIYPDPGHEYGLSPLNASNDTFTAVTDNEYIHTEAQSVKLVNSEDGVLVLGTDDLGTPESYGLSVGDEITFSSWVYVPTGAIFGASMLHAGGSGMVQAHAAPPSKRDEWTQISVTTEVADVDGEIILSFSSSDNSEPYWVDDIGVAPGTEAVDYNGSTPDPVVGTYDYVWTGTPGASATHKLNNVYSTPIDVTPSIVNNSVVSHNFVKSTKARNYGPYANNVSSINISNYGKYENGNIVRAQVNNTNPTTEIGLYATPTYGLGVIPSGTVFTFSVDVNMSADLNANQLRVFFRDDANGDNEAASFRASTPAVVSHPTKGRWHRYSWTCTVDPGRSVTSAYIVVEGISNQPAGATLDTANWMIEEGTDINPYFNGDSPDYGQYRFFWNGIEEASMTNKVLISVAESNKVDMEQFVTRFEAPAGAATAKVFIDMDGFNGKDTLLVAQVGAREEPDTTWVPETADVLGSIIKSSAKPAGVVLHWKPIVSDWDTVTAHGTRPWSELDDLTWVQVEELT